MKLKLIIIALFTVIFNGCAATQQPSKLNYNVLLNPYGYTPLTAMISIDGWDSAKDIVARVSIAGKTADEMPLVYSIPLKINTEEKTQLPVIGLFAGHLNRVEISFNESSGKQLKRLDLEIQTNPIAFSFAETPVTKGKLTANELIFTTIYSFELKKGEDMIFIQKAIALDGKGRIRWFSDFKGRSHVVTEVIDGYLYAGSNKGPYAGKMVKYNFLGKELEVYDISKNGKYYNIHHDIRKTEKGAFFLTVNERDKTSVENMVLEYNPNLLGNNVQLELDLEALLPNMDDFFTDLPFSYYAGKKDPLHINGIYPYPDGEHLLVSSRNAGLAKVNATSYQLRWILFPHALKASAAEKIAKEERGTKQYLEKRMQLYKKDKQTYQRVPANGIIPYEDYSDFTFRYEEFLLHPVNRNGKIIKDENVVAFGEVSTEFSYPYRQHAPILLKNGNIAMFDNGDRDKPGKNISRAVEYKIIEDKDGYGGQVQQVWQYSTPKKDFAPYVGDIRELDSGNRLVCFGSINFKNVPKPSQNTKALIVELIPSSPAKEVYSLELSLVPGSVVYRANTIDISKLILQ